MSIEPSRSGADSSRQGHVRALDGVRGIAILCVLAFHFVQELAPGGAIGVDLFFTLSAFLITTLLLREQDREGRIGRGDFYWRRVARLLPALLIFTILEAPLVAVAVGTGGQILTSSVIVLTYLADFGTAGFLPFAQVYGHTWSLAVEEQFYLVWPTVLVLLLARRARLVRVATILWVCATATTVVLEFVIGPSTNYFLPTGHVASLAAGVVAAFLLREAHGSPRWWDRPAWGLLSLLTILTMVVLRQQDWDLVTQLSVGAIFSIPAAAVLILHAASAHGAVARTLSWSPLTWFGTRSYGIYLYHWPLLLLFRGPRVPFTRTVDTVLAVGVSLVLSELSFRYVERPVMRWSRARRRPAASTSLDTERAVATEVTSS